MPLPVLMVVASEDDGGMVRVAALLAARLRLFDVDVRAVVHREAPLTESLHAAGVPYDVVPQLLETPTRPRDDRRSGVRAIVTNIGGVPTAARTVANIARQHGAAVLYSHNTWAHYTCSLAAVTLRHTVACAWHIHNDHSRLPTRALDRLAIRLGRVRAIAAVSKSIGRPFEGLSVGIRRQAFPPGTASPPAARAALLTVVTNGIDLDRCEAAAREPCLRAALGLGRDAVVVVYAGRLVAHKGIGVLLEAARRAISATPDLHFVILGGNPRHERRDVIAEMRARADGWGLQGRVHFPGFVTNVERWVADANIAVVPSICADGYPLAAIEALSLGVPVVASAVGGLQEMIRDGDDGLLVPPGDPGALAAAVVNLARAPARRQRMSQSSRASARDRFDARRMTADVAAMLHRAAGGVRAPTSGRD